MKRDYTEYAAKKTFREWVFPEYIGRLSFFLRITMLVVIVALLEILSAGLNLGEEATWEELPLYILALLMMIYIILLWIYLKSCLSPRIRDLGLSSKCWLILLVPIVGQVLFLMILTLPSGGWTKIQKLHKK